ncbi:MAG: hypothetical protein K2X91_05630, partial [Thermoleophilia bacterium]|nr:hypothetical protein [Thermoleophilia bacterium]
MLAWVRPDSRSVALVRTPGSAPRPREQVLAHYLLERSLSDRLREADRDERRRLYGVVYDELFRSLPHHP